MKIKVIPPVYLVCGSIIIILAYSILPGLNIIPFPYNLSGLIILFAGFYVLGNAYQLFEKYQTPHNFDTSTSIITEGVFRWSRNPMYLGMMLLLAGLSVCFGNIISLLVPFLFFMIISLVFIPLEEQKMLGTFGEDYLHYKVNTHKWF